MTSIRSIRRRGQRGYLNLDFTGMFIGLVVFGIAVGIGLMVAVPWLWSWLKPIIHGLTA